MEIKIFYSWQSDLPNNTNRGFIEKALQNAVKSIRNDDSITVEPVIDRDTIGFSGSPKIPETILQKIDEADVFVCDVSIINNGSKFRPTSNPNVLFELGYALKRFNWDKVIMVMNTAFGEMNKLPFDLEKRRITPYSITSNIDDKATERTKLEKQLEAAIRLIIEKADFQQAIVEIVTEEKQIISETDSIYSDMLDSIKKNEYNTAGTLKDYFEKFAENLIELTIEPEKDVDFDEKVLESIESFTSYRDEIIEVCLAIAKYTSNSEIYSEIHRFFELLLPYCASKPINKNQWISGENDNLRFMVHELFLYVVSILIKYDRFIEASDLLSQNYYSQQFATIEGLQTNSFDYSKFNTYFQFYSLRDKNDRENLQSKLFRDRATRKEITFEDIMQSDFLLYLYSVLHLQGYFAEFSWYPFTNSSAVFRQQPFEVFSRAQSIRYFERLKKLIIIDSKQKLIDLIEKGKTENGYVPGYGNRLGKISLDKLMNIDKLATTP